MDTNYQTPCYIFDRNDFENNIKMFQKVLQQHFGNNWILGYSFKTNYLPYIIKSARDAGCYAEVVSSKEYLLAKNLGFNNDQIIFNGPVKQKEHFLDAIKNHAIINIDSKREIDWLNELPQEKQYNIGIRINYDLEHELPGHTLMGREGGRFGFCDDNDELKNAISAINKFKNIKLNYLHMHVSSKTKSTEIYKSLVRKACEIIDREKLSIDFIDVGGSFFGGGDNGKAYDKYISAIKSELISLGKKDMGLIVEPGASLIATSVKYMVEVVDTKSTPQNNYIVTDGSRLHIDPFFARNSYSYNVISKSQTNIIPEQTIVGYTCMEKDRFMKINHINKLLVGDKILFNTIGSYTMCMNSDFISSEPRVYAEYEDRHFLVRDEKEIECYLNRDLLEEVQ